MILINNYKKYIKSEIFRSNNLQEYNFNALLGLLLLISFFLFTEFNYGETTTNSTYNYIIINDSPFFLLIFYQLLVINKKKILI